MTKTVRITRVNARLPEDDAKKLAYLAKIERKSVSDIVRTAIQRYYDEKKSEEAAASGMLFRIGFVGCGEAEPDLSKNYKQYLTESLRRKYGHR
jgi:hypothetical protein